MDLLSLACDEVGLDSFCDVVSPDYDLAEPFAVQLHITEEERPDRLERMIARPLSYQPEGDSPQPDKLQEVLQQIG